MGLTLIKYATFQNSAHNDLVSIISNQATYKRASINPKHIETLSMLLALNKAIEVSQLDVHPTRPIANVIPPSNQSPRTPQISIQPRNPSLKVVENAGRCV